jgi:hypothetical protein
MSFAALREEPEELTSLCSLASFSRILATQLEMIGLFRFHLLQVFISIIRNSTG